MRRPRGSTTIASKVVVVTGAIVLAVGIVVADSRHVETDTTPPSPTLSALMDPGHGQSYALAFGDSYFTGSEDVTQAQTFGRLALNSMGYSVAVRGHGATGYVTGSHIDGWPNYVSQVSDESLSHMPTDAITVIVLEGGVNDAIVDVDPRLVQLNANWVMRTLHARYPHAIPVVLGVPPDDSGVLRDERLAINAAIARAAAAAQWHFLDTRELITPALVARIIGPDRLHPTPLGHRRLAVGLRSMLAAVGVPTVGSSGKPVEVISS